jgi:hypothetical protein
MWTKGQIVDQAYDELALANYVFDLTPEERQSALRRLDAMMATWMNNGMSLPYAFSLDPADSTLDDASGLPLIAIEAAYTNLAKRIAHSKGKQIPPGLSAAASEAYEALSSRMARDAVQQQQMPLGTPAGAGRKPRGDQRGPFLPFPETSTLQTDFDDGLSFS